MREKVEIQAYDFRVALAGNLDQNFHYIEKQLGVEIILDSEGIVIHGDGDAVEKGKRLFENLIAILELGDEIDQQKIDYGLELVKQQNGRVDFYKHIICMTVDGKAVKPKTLGQQQYLEMIEEKDLIFGVGPAGTGKTYLAVAMAIKAFKSGEVERIIITRPAIEAGENLGFLPGDLQMKVDPYLRPIYDAMDEILGREVFMKYKDRKLIEIAPLAYMRGRTLDKAFIILDEAQNTTVSQMKMFLTRFGYGSKIVINGDVTQVDLKQNKHSGLSHALHVLKGLDEIGVMQFTENDVIRHALVKKIIKQYETYEALEG